jgi:DNA-binding response OmpR family regulator
VSTILAIEDDPAILEGLRALLAAEGYEVLTAMDGEAGLQRALSDSPDLILLDIMLPKLNGLEVLKAIRTGKRIIPVIMLTSKKEEIDKVMGLEFGADDYVTKPFSTRELTARIKAVLRRMSVDDYQTEEYRFSNITVNFRKHEVKKNGIELHLSVTEYKMLCFFIKHGGEIVTRDMLLDEVWGYDAYPSTRTVDNFVLSLRKQIEVNPAEPKHIITVHRAGYKFRE